MIEHVTVELIKSLSEVYTHAGKFHADDLFSSALLLYINPSLKITRVMKVPEDYEGLAYDIGLGEYDHHNTAAKNREDGSPYAAFGLLWRDLGPELVSEHSFKQIEENFVKPLDLNDNTGIGNPLAFAVSRLNSTWDETNCTDDMMFEDALKVAMQILSRIIDSARSSDRATLGVEEALSKCVGDVLVLDKFLPWGGVEGVYEKDYIVYPSNRGGYGIRAIPSKEPLLQQGNKVPFPTEWADREVKEFGELLPGLTYIHHSGFYASAETVDVALELCKRTKEYYKENYEEVDLANITLVELSESKEEVILYLTDRCAYARGTFGLGNCDTDGFVFDYIDHGNEKSITVDFMTNFRLFRKKDSDGVIRGW